MKKLIRTISILVFVSSTLFVSATEKKVQLPSEHKKNGDVIWGKEFSQRYGWNEAKAACEQKEPKMNWRLPSQEDFQKIIDQGIESVVPYGHERIYWTSTVANAKAGQVFAYYGPPPFKGKLIAYETESDGDYVIASVVCVSSANAK